MYGYYCGGIEDTICAIDFINKKYKIEMKNRFKKGVALLAIVPFLFGSCAKEEGPGGSSTIYGRVWVEDWNSNFSKLNDQYWAQEERVYLLYGNDTIYSKDFRTDDAGCYKFDYLTKGNYTIYALSKDKDNPTSPMKVRSAVTVKISKNNQTVEAPKITIYD